MNTFKARKKILVTQGAPCLFVPPDVIIVRFCTHFRQQFIPVRNHPEQWSGFHQDVVFPLQMRTCAYVAPVIMMI